MILSDNDFEKLSKVRNIEEEEREWQLTKQLWKPDIWTIEDGPSHETCQSLLNMVNQDEFTCLDTKQNVYHVASNVTKIKNLQKCVVYLSYFSILIWKDYVLYWDFDSKSWIMNVFTRGQKKTSKQLSSVENLCTIFSCLEKILIKNFLIKILDHTFTF